MIKISRSFNNSTTRNSITIRLLSQVVSSKSNSNTSSNSSINSSSSSSSSISSKSTTSNKVIVVDGNSQLDYSTVGRYYQTLVHKGGQGALGLRDLKHLFEKCLQPDHLKYAIKGKNLCHIIILLDNTYLLFLSKLLKCIKERDMIFLKK